MLSVRRARLDDMQSVYDLSNDPAVRAASFESDHIEYETHIQWFTSRISDSNVLFLVFLDQQELVAQVRFTREAATTVEVGVCISAEYRGKGLGLEIMRKAISCLVESWKVDRIEARVKPDNRASNRYFTKCGYVFDALCEYKSHPCFLYHYTV